MPKSYSAGQDLFQQLSRHDQLIKRILWDEKYIDLHDKNRKCLIGNTHSAATRYDYKKLLQKLNHDSRANDIEALKFNSTADPAFLEYITQNDPDIVISCGDVLAKVIGGWRDFIDRLPSGEDEEVFIA